jgi:hypothetical protein
MRARLAEFLQSLPEDLPDPDILLEEDGMYCVDWNNAQHETFSVSVGERGYSYAWINPDGGSGRGFIERGKEAEMVAILVKIVGEYHDPR